MMPARTELSWIAIQIVMQTDSNWFQQGRIAIRVEIRIAIRSR